jgi:peptidoglycan-associated lipoprotein
MSSFASFGRGLRVAVVLAVALTIAACAQNKDKQGLAGNVTPGSAQDFVVNVGDRVFFPTDQTTLTAQAHDTLNKQAQWLRLYPQYTVTIEGHADERGTREYNLALGDRRANSVKNYLVALGVSGDRISTISYGKERPVRGNTCSAERCWSLNRRGVMVVN